MNICLFEKTQIASPLPLFDKRVQHIIKVLHKNVGDTFLAGIIEGPSGVAKITNITKKEFFFDFVPDSDTKKTLPLFPIDVIIGLVRPIQLKRLLKDLSTLGVQKIHLVKTQLTEKSYLNATLLDYPSDCDIKKSKIYTYLLDGAMQAKSTHIPTVFVYESLALCLKKIESTVKCKIALDNLSPCGCLKDFVLKRKATLPLSLAIGSERGWVQLERDMLKDNGFCLLSFGKRVLRTETAVICSVQLLSCLLQN